jgi:hypothetical protein
VLPADCGRIEAMHAKMQAAFYLTCPLTNSDPSFPGKVDLASCVMDEDGSVEDIVFVHLILLLRIYEFVIEYRINISK